MEKGNLERLKKICIKLKFLKIYLYNTNKSTNYTKEKGWLNDTKIIKFSKWHKKYD